MIVTIIKYVDLDFRIREVKELKGYSWDDLRDMRFFVCSDLRESNKLYQVLRNTVFGSYKIGSIGWSVQFTPQFSENSETYLCVGIHRDLQT